MDITELIKHPEHLDRDTLYELRSLIALHPYFQTARLLMLQNLYLLHDPTFDEELRRAAVYITDRNKIFQLVEAAHYSITPETKDEKKEDSNTDADRTISLIDTFLESIPKEEEPAEEQPRKKRRPTSADATVDYVAYLIESESFEAKEEQTQMKGQNLIDDFIENDHGRIKLNEIPEFTPELEPAGSNGNEEFGNGVFTETLARIYIKQRRYDKALEIIRQLSLNYPKKNVYFADQIRFLEKLVVNENATKGS